VRGCDVQARTGLLEPVPRRVRIAAVLLEFERHCVEMLRDEIELVARTDDDTMIQLACLQSRSWRTALTRRYEATGPWPCRSA
jgi:hypothetical protein